MNDTISRFQGHNKYEQDGIMKKGPLVSSDKEWKMILSY